MKRLIAILLGILIFSGCGNKSAEKNGDFIKRQVFIKELIEASEIEIKYIREPKAQEYFKDVDDASPYAMALITALDAGIISTNGKKIYGDEALTYKEALDYIDRAYRFKTNNEILISNEIKKELISMDKNYEKMRNKDFIDEKLKKYMMDAVKGKLKSKLKNPIKDNLTSDKDVRVYTAKVDDMLMITLDWGEKPTGGYIIRIVEAKEVKNNTIEVIYYTKSPGPKDIVTQAITHPKDSTKIKVNDISKEYKVVLKPQAK